MTRVVLAFALLAAAARAEDRPREVYGTLEGDTTWEGRVAILEDVIVPAGVTLTINPGTEVLASLQFPGGGAGWNKQMLEIHVKGAIRALGTVSQPIRFAPLRVADDADRNPRPWLGVVMLPSRTGRSRFAHCVFEEAQAAVQVADDSPEFDRCVFLRCGVGVGTALWADAMRPGPRSVRDSTPEISYSRFLHCTVGLSVELQARPTVLRSLFYDCELALGNQRAGIAWVTRGLGPVVDHCEFVRNGMVMSGPGRVTNGIVVGNAVVFSPSHQVRACAHGIDRLLLLNNLFWDNTTLTAGDVTLGEGALFADPRARHGWPAEMSDETLETPFEDLCRYPENSPVNGAAHDGGGLGILGARGSPQAEAQVDLRTLPGLPLGAWLLAGPPGEVEWKAMDELADAEPRPGDLFGDMVWADAPAPADAPSSPGAEYRAAGDGWCVASTRVVAPREMTAELRIGLDGRCRVRWNGEEVLADAGPRRFDPDDRRARLGLRAGANRLVVVFRVRGDRPRFSARLLPVPDGPALDGVTTSAVPEEGDDARDGDDDAGRMRITGVRREAIRDEKHRATGHWNFSLKFSEPVHWADAIDPAQYVLRSDDDVRVPFAPGQLHYDVAKRRLEIRDVEVLTPGRYELHVGTAWRDPRGRPYEVDARSHSFLFR